MKLWPFSSLCRTSLFRYRRCTLFLGQAYLRARLFKNAEAAFRRAIERDDDNSEAHDGLAFAFSGKDYMKMPSMNILAPRRCSIIAWKHT